MIGLAHEQISMWWIAIGMGAVVVVAVIVLLSLLLSFVNDIDRRVSDALENATRIAGNTGQLSALGETVEWAGVLRDELYRHAQTLASVRG
ncbi:MAG: hypothetical protein ACRDZ8_13995 [Acidimicrobiales bacterium]